MMDMGTDNEWLLKDEFYLGTRRKRVRGKEFWEFAEKSLNEISKKWPYCVVQFEDLSPDIAFDLLTKFRDKFPCFNDDIQG